MNGTNGFKPGPPARIGVLGAGIMGCCLALELARRGRRVDLIDRADAPMTGASLHNEGKLHLGFVYANDPSRETHGLMARGSLAFSRIIKRLTGCDDAALAPSRPFHYFVPVDSQLDLTTIAEHFREVDAMIHEAARTNGGGYLGCRPERFHEQNEPHVHERLFSSDSTLGSFRTEERSISPVALARILRRAVSSADNIEFIGNTEIVAVDRLGGGEAAVEARRAGESVRLRYPCVANCLWEDRIRVDKTAGIDDAGPWIFRYKATITIPASTNGCERPPSATGILGPYGDVVSHGDGSFYISWYPLSKVAQSTQEDGRILHDRVHTAFVPRFIRKLTAGFPNVSSLVASVAHSDFIKENIRAMASYIPAMSSLSGRGIRGRLGGGVIVARGRTDIDDPDSTLHQRSVIGPVAHGSYVTIDTGKYCMAPLFSQQAADMIVRILP